MTEDPQQTNEPASSEDESNWMALGVGMGLALGAGLGVALGAAIGAATGDVGMWVAMGVPIGASIGLTFGIVFAAIKQQQEAKGACFKCGYSTKGLRTGTCPECGAELSEQERDSE